MGDEGIQAVVALDETVSDKHLKKDISGQLAGVGQTILM